MPEGCWLAIAFLANLVGMGWFALAIENHWQQVHGRPFPPRRALRCLGVLALSCSLAACFRADHASMAPLVWVMTLAVAASSIAMILAWRPRLLFLLAPLRAE